MPPFRSGSQDRRPWRRRLRRSCETLLVSVRLSETSATGAVLCSSLISQNRAPHLSSAREFNVFSSSAGCVHLTAGQTLQSTALVVNTMSGRRHRLERLAEVFRRRGEQRMPRASPAIRGKTLGRVTDAEKKPPSNEEGLDRGISSI